MPTKNNPDHTNNDGFGSGRFITYGSKNPDTDSQHCPQLYTCIITLTIIYNFLERSRINRNNFNRWSVPELSQRARAPLRLSMEGVGELISPDFCLTIPLLAQSWDYNKPEK
jgi:hypothetical protein